MTIMQDEGLKISKKVAIPKSAFRFLPGGCVEHPVLSLMQQEQILETLENPSQLRTKGPIVHLSSILEKHPILGGAKVLGSEVCFADSIYLCASSPMASQIWESLLKLVTAVPFAPDEIIVDAADFAALAPFACLLKGEAAELDAQGHQLSVLIPGRFLLARAGVHTVRARTTGALLRVPLAEYDAFVRRHPEADVAGKARVLRDLPYFSHWGLTTTRNIAYLFRSAAYGPGDMIYSAFQAVDELFLVAEGSVRCTWTTPPPAAAAGGGGQRRRRADRRRAVGGAETAHAVVLVRGDVFGLPMCLDGTVSDHWAEPHGGRCAALVLCRRGIELLDIPALAKLHSHRIAAAAAAAPLAAAATAPPPGEGNTVEPFPARASSVSPTLGTFALPAAAAEHLGLRGGGARPARSKSTLPYSSAAEGGRRFRGLAGRRPAGRDSPPPLPPGFPGREAARPVAGAAVGARTLIATEDAQLKERRGARIQARGPCT